MLCSCTHMATVDVKGLTDFHGVFTVHGSHNGLCRNLPSVFRNMAISFALVVNMVSAKMVKCACDFQSWSEHQRQDNADNTSTQLDRLLLSSVQARYTNVFSPGNSYENSCMRSIIVTLNSVMMRTRLLISNNRRYKTIVYVYFFMFYYVLLLRMRFVLFTAQHVSSVTISCFLQTNITLWPACKQTTYRCNAKWWNHLKCNKKKLKRYRANWRLNEMLF